MYWKNIFFTSLMNFNSIHLHDLSEFKIIRYLSRTSTQYKYVAIHVPTKKFVIIDEKVELPGSNKAQDEYSKLLYDLGPQDNIIQYLGFAHLDGRTYLVTKLYELGDLGTMISRYDQNMLSLPQESILLLFLQLVKTIIYLFNNGVYPHLNPQTIFLEEKVQTYYPEVDLIDEGGMSRKARVNLRLSAVELLSNISTEKPNINIDEDKTLNFN